MNRIIRAIQRKPRLITRKNHPFGDKAPVIYEGDTPPTTIYRGPINTYGDRNAPTTEETETPGTKARQ